MMSTTVLHDIIENGKAGCKHLPKGDRKPGSDKIWVGSTGAGRIE